MTVISSKILVDSPTGEIRRIALNRPDNLNAIDEDTRDALQCALEGAMGDHAVKAVILTGTGANFSAGGDIRYMQTLDGTAFAAFHERLLNLCLVIGKARKPIIGAVRGSCAGGAFGLALACDHLIASTSTRFLIPFMRIGLTPDMALPYWLARRIGAHAARSIILQDQPIAAARALKAGICDQVAEDGELDGAALQMADRMAAFAPEALRQTRLLLASSTLPFEAYLDAERAAARSCLGSPEFKEGVAAFLEKRPPVWPQSNTGE